jgi:uncharacterized membrane protein
MKAKNSIKVFIITLVFTVATAGVDLFATGEKYGDNAFTVLAMLGILGNIIAFFVALVAAWQEDSQEE